METTTIRAQARVGIAFLGVISFALIASSPAAAAPLAEEIKQLLKTHPQIKAAQQNVAGTKETIRESKSPFYPTVAVDGDVGPSRIDSPATRARGGSGVFEGRQDNIGAVVDLNLFDGFRKYANLSRAHFEKAAAEYSLEATRQLITLQGVSAYVDVLRQRKLLELAELSEANIQRQFALETERARRGSGLTVDVLQAKAKFADRKGSRGLGHGALYATPFPATSRFSTGRRPCRKWSIRTRRSGLFRRRLKMRFPKGARRTRSSRAARGKSMLRIKSAAPPRRITIPSWDLVFEGRRRNNVDGIVGLRKELSVLVKARWELFSGFSRQARVARASTQRSITVSNHRDLDRQISDSVRIAWNSFETARERRELLEGAIDIAAEVFEARQQLRAAGKETVINDLLSENEVTNARIQFNSAYYDMLLATYQLHFAIGTLSPQNLGITQ